MILSSTKYANQMKSSCLFFVSFIFYALLRCLLFLMNTVCVYINFLTRIVKKKQIIIFQLLIFFYIWSQYLDVLSSEIIETYLYIICIIYIKDLYIYNIQILYIFFFIISLDKTSRYGLSTWYIHVPDY
jgi:hypothetical protein